MADSPDDGSLSGIKESVVVDSKNGAEFSKAVEKLQKDLTAQQVSSGAGPANDQSVYELVYVCRNFPQWSSEKSVTLTNTFITDLSLRYLARLQQLEALCFNRTTITGAGLQYLTKLPNLRRLELSQCKKLRPEDSKVIGHFPNLTSLNLNEVALDAGSLHEVARLKQLELLRLDCTAVTGDGLRWLTALPKLIELDVSGCERLLPEDFILVGQLHSLAELHAYKTYVGPAGLAALKNLKLRVLRVSDAKITDKGLLDLRNMPLNMLMIGNDQITDVGIAALTDLPLERLRITINLNQSYKVSVKYRIEI